MSIHKILLTAGFSLFFTGTTMILNGALLNIVLSFCIGFTSYFLSDFLDDYFV